MARKPNFSASLPSKDASIIEMDADTKASALMHINKTFGCLQTLYEDVTKDKLVVSTRHNVISVARSYLKWLNDLLGGEGEDQDKMDEYLRELRAANEENYRLQQLLGNSANLEGISNRLYEMSYSIKEWWTSFGFLTAKVKIDASYGNNAFFAVKFSCDVDKFGRIAFIADRKPVTNKEIQDNIIKNLIQQTDLVDAESHHPYFLDTLRNRQFVMNKVRERYPDVRFLRFYSYVNHFNKEEITILRDFKVYLPFENVLKSQIPVEPEPEPKPKTKRSKSHEQVMRRFAARQVNKSKKK